MSTFAKKIQERMGSAVSDQIPRGEWNGVEYKHIYLNCENNFIDGAYQKESCIKGDLPSLDIKYHRGASHMNSSQVMCISFFRMFFEKPEYENILLDILRDSGIEIAAEDQIKAAAFEYEPCNKERTNFDFFILLHSGVKISFEIKYTESEFGGISPDKNNPCKYDRKWNNIYKNMVSGCPFLAVGKEEFYENYQINRNITYAGANDYVLFLTPAANHENGIEKGRKYIDKLNHSHIKNLYWEEIIEKTKTAVCGFSELRKYYEEFYDKYIRILD